jgi:glutathione S-transferase
MAAIKLTYFDFDRGRGEDCRLALHVAGVDFEDDRVSTDWRERKSHTPFRNLPVLRLEGRGELGQSNAILTFIGRTYGLHPTDPWEAARHEALLAFAEELRERLGPSLSMKDPEEKKRAREAFAGGYLLSWAQCVEAQLGSGPFVAGEALNVVDLKLYVLTRWFTSGGVDHIPPDVFAPFPKLSRLYESVDAHPGVRSWYALRAQRAALATASRSG